MTKAEIVNEVAKSTGIEKATVQIVVESFMECVKGSLAKGNPIYLRGFGSFIIISPCTTGIMLTSAPEGAIISFSISFIFLYVLLIFQASSRCNASYSKATDILSVSEAFSMPIYIWSISVPTKSHRT